MARVTHKDIDFVVAKLNERLGKTGEWNNDGSILVYCDDVGYKIEQVVVSKKGTGAENLSSYGLTAKETMHFLDGIFAGLKFAGGK